MNETHVHSKGGHTNLRVSWEVVLDRNVGHDDGDALQPDVVRKVAKPGTAEELPLEPSHPTLLEGTVDHAGLGHELDVDSLRCSQRLVDGGGEDLDVAILFDVGRRLLK